MKTEDSDVNERKEAWDRAYDSDKKKTMTIAQPMIMVMIGVVVAAAFFIFIGPSFFKLMDIEGHKYDYIKSEYGVQDVSWSKFGLNVDAGGKTLMCERPTEQEKAAHAPIRCGGNVTLRSNKVSN